MPPARLTYTYSSGSLPSYCIAFRPLNKGGQKINHQSCKEQLIDHDSYRFVDLYYTILASFASITPTTAFSDYYHHTLIAITFAKPCHLSSVYSCPLSHIDGQKIIRYNGKERGSNDGKQTEKRYTATAL